ncbi:Phox (PX) domain-containing protein [Raphanus sativus]|uniref:PX domain-containing protein EREL1 isoform X1 n=1 Tax=Raphanus sativus TaxID=3726 RepID=A0A9W3DNE9_RAPSA|nr:PX domain-containing protein EREL1 isoform X1 [Raphanus sativus]KAJ4899151.1 Phox (PX) domain-containing protein [Raphanus sativus]
MMQRRSPPKHRHDGTSPLPLGMDWSPPPRKLNGGDTVWPHDSRTGWSYCVTIPSWAVLPKSKNSDPVVFYRVQITVQSPEGVTTMRGVLRRFNDFLKLLTDLKKAFPSKSFPSAPPKGLLRMKSRALLEERRCSLEEWITKLLSDIELARSVVVASFLELEAAARSACQDVDQNASDANNDRNSTSSSPMAHPSLSLFQPGGSSSLTSDYGSDTVYETSELGSPSVGHDDISEIGTEDLTLDEEVTNPIEKLANFSMSNIDEGLSMSQTILEQLEDFPKHKVRSRYVNNIQGKDAYNRNASKGVFLGNNGSRHLYESESSAPLVMHDRNLSVESADGFSLPTGETSTSGLLSSSNDSHLDLHRGAGVSLGTGIVCDPERQGSAQIVLPLDLRKKLNRILVATNERLVNAKTDMEDLIARLNQEIAVKEYLNRKVNDLEGELETTKQRSKENLEQAILTERERCTQMQWDMEELRQKSYEMEMKLKSREDGRSSHEEPTEQPTNSERYVLSKELDARKQQMEDLSRRYDELEAKSKADIKVLVKEVKSLRRSHVELEKKLTQSLTDKTEAEKLLEHERKLLENTVSARKKLLSDCRILHDRLKEYNLNLSTDGNGSLVEEDSTTVSDALRLLSISDDQIEEAQLLAGFDENVVAQGIDNETRIMEDELRKILADIFVENAKLRKQVNSATLRALQKDVRDHNQEDVETTTRPAHRS